MWKATERRVYRGRPLVWLGPLLVVTAVALFVLLRWSGEGPPLGIQILGGAACAFLLWLSYWSRIKVTLHGLQVYNPIRPMRIGWAEIQKFELRESRNPRPWGRRSIVLVLVDSEVDLPVGTTYLFGDRKRLSAIISQLEEAKAAVRTG